MKKKALFFGTLGASILLAGGVFAAWAVTDNAEKIGIKISPSQISDDKTGTVTLSWDATHSTTFTDIGGLTIGTPVERTVKVKADAYDDKNVATTYEGTLTVELQDLSGKAAEAQKLIDYLTVNVLDGETSLGKVGLVNSAHVSQITPAVETNASGKVITFSVSIDASAQPYINSIKNDRVYLSVDWGRSASDTGIKHVYIPANGWSNMWVYSYGASGQNAEFPGVQLQQDTETGYFIADLNATHTNFIFSTKTDSVVTGRYPGDGEPGATQAQLKLDVAGNIYFNWSTHQFQAAKPDSDAPFYLVGEATESWTMLAANGFALHDDDKPEGSLHQWKAEVTVEANKEYKIRSLDGNTWCGYDQVEEGCRSLLTGAESNNFKFNAANTYEIYLKQYSTYYSVYITVKAAA